MRLPRVLFTVRGMMVAVAIVGVTLGAERWVFAYLVSAHRFNGEPGWVVILWELVCINAVTIALLGHWLGWWEVGGAD